MSCIDASLVQPSLCFSLLLSPPAVCVYHGADRDRRVASLRKYDVVSWAPRCAGCAAPVLLPPPPLPARRLLLAFASLLIPAAPPLPSRSLLSTVTAHQVITTYSTLAAEAGRCDGVTRVPWLRLVLDEASPSRGVCVGGGGGEPGVGTC